MVGRALRPRPQSRLVVYATSYRPVRDDAANAYATTASRRPIAGALS